MTDQSAPDPLSAECARALDAADPLVRFRERFFMPEGQIYLDDRLD